VGDLGGNRVFKIAAGANVDDYRWTEVLMREAGRYMDGLSLHYYTVPGPDWEHKGSATEFDEDGWFAAMRKCLYMDELIRRHAAIMDQYDPQQRVAMVVDEWGAWHDVESGANPGFLYQQNTLRDALVAGITLNIFNNHCDRVRMANLAQTVNVLQALILTDGPSMLTTPTYHVFDLYKDHQDAILLPSHLESGDYELNGQHIPQISVSASRAASGRVLLTFCNVDPHRQADVACDLWGARLKELEGTALLTAERMHMHNTFSHPETLVPVAFEDLACEPDSITFVLPPMSVLAFRILVV
jgi:alpha-N-arabinofuranosidase